MCVKFNAFVFNGEEFVQHRGLAMGSPLSAVISCLYMKTLEINEYKRIIGKGSNWYRYVDDILVIVPKNTNLENKLRMLNTVNTSIQFTIENEVNGKIPFLDTLITRSDQGPRFSVYRKPTNKDDYIHFLSGHSERVKSGVIIGFFLRALRICSSEYLKDECDYIIRKFKELAYPMGLLIKLKDKAIKIRNRCERESESSENETREQKVYIAVPNSKESVKMDGFLERSGIKIARTSGRKIGDIVRKRKNTENINQNSVIYAIPCESCPSVYYGETHLGLEKRLNDHKSDLRHHRTSNSLVVHVDQFNHLPMWKEARVLKRGLNKGMRKALEAAYISKNKRNASNHREGFICWAKQGAHLALSNNDRNRQPTNQSNGRTEIRRTAGGHQAGT